jgi:2-methylisocitrate lyase-like PEP mutase family enzyme
MISQASKAAQFLELHQPGDPLLLPNPWDRGSAQVLASLGFRALATTSGGFAMSLGRQDGWVTRDEALVHASDIVDATDLPVSADLERGFADEPAAVARTVELAIATGLAGCSIEDATGSPADPVYGAALAADRIAAAAQAAHSGDVRFVLTARAENYLHGRQDLADTIARLQAYQEAGADVLFAPGLTSLSDIRQVVASVDRPVNVLALASCPPAAELAAAGVARISAGSTLFRAAYAALAQAGTELRDRGTYSYTGSPGQAALRAAFAD